VNSVAISVERSGREIFSGGWYKSALTNREVACVTDKLLVFEKTTIKTNNKIMIL